MTIDMDSLNYSEKATVEQKFHLILLCGRLLLQNSVATGRVYQAVYQLADVFNWQVRLFVDYKVLTLTAQVGNRFISRFSRNVQAMNINMAVITHVYRVIDAIKKEQITPEEAVQELERIDAGLPHYNHWLLILMLGITSGSLAKLFGADWQTFMIVFIATALGVVLRQQLVKRKLNPFLISFLAAFLGGCIGGIAVRLGWSSTPELCLIVPSLMLVPGVHLINAILDLLENHITIGIARLGLSFVTLSSIAFGLLLAASATETLISASSKSVRLPLAEDMFFAGLVAMGFALAFNVPQKMLAACVLCGMVGHGMREICLNLDLGIVWGNLIASSLVGVMTVYFSRRYQAPSAAIAFGAVVGMIPGVFIFRAISGLTQILALGTATELSLLVNTVIAATKAVLMTLAIPVGLAIPRLLFFKFELK
ncbi:threonine/serine exporter ThrE family protein [Lyngbya sp. PCC 8106]|uniref:threonine/serine ThrE exporter family protein n=1 Tax=Lyngbya sp. (strain PCC 8106) TaxID=313612 RepID=UPI0000EAAA97|nr:threonine/serine exporter family protein [Lyngbya sp. PCC 8106]EAW35946.1 hypothetical protein L8106_07726 [Lyngbya sp. PCC 8106]